MYEIESAQLAQGKARSAEVKALAAMILKDHQKSTADLKASAAKANPPIDVAGILDTDQASNLGRLRNAAAEDFDALYLQQQIEAHEKSLAMVRSYAASGDQPSLKQHAAAGAGPIEAHLNRAKELSANSGH
jgi:putative membrane protein